MCGRKVCRICLIEKIPAGGMPTVGFATNFIITGSGEFCKQKGTNGQYLERTVIFEQKKP
jgi:hypothetical protein